MPEIILDHIKPISVDKDDPPLSNCHALVYLTVGLHSIAKIITDKEVKYSSKKWGPSNRPITMLFDFGDDDTMNLIACYFHWFAISLVNYVRLIGLMGVMAENGWTRESLVDKEIAKRARRCCRDYAEEIIPNVLQWRHKVAAHFAATDPRWDDNLSTLVNSVIQPISYKRPYFYAGQLHISPGGQKLPLPDWSWSLTEVFEELKPRYWPTTERLPWRYVKW